MKIAFSHEDSAFACCEVTDAILSRLTNGFMVAKQRRFVDEQKHGKQALLKSNSNKKIGLVF